MAEETVEAGPEVQENGNAQAVGQTELVSEPKSDAEQMISQRDFRAHQSSMDKQIAQLRRERDDMQKQLKEMKLQSVPEDQREFEELRLENERLREVADQAQRFQVLNEISRDYGVPIGILEDATSTMHAQTLALQWYREQQQGNTGQPAGTSPTTPAASQPKEHQAFVAPEQPGKSGRRDFAKELEDAMSAKDMRTYYAIVREAREAGMDI